MNLIYEKLNIDNLDLIIKIQNEIFPQEDATDIYKMSFIKNKYYGEMTYYIVYDGDSKSDNIVGITGIYSYADYLDDAWLGYFGVLKEKRKKGYGINILRRFEEEAKEKNYKNIRLYTNKKNFPEAFKLYKRFGMIEERYTNFKKKVSEDIYNNEYVFSKGLYSKMAEPWNNKLILDYELFDL